MSATLALINANVRTMCPRQPHAEAVAIRKNKITKVGTNEEVNQLIGKRTKVINLVGKTIVPGLIDTHVHVADFGRCLLWLDLTAAASIKELKSLLNEKAKQTRAGKWIIGRGWNETRFKEKRSPSVADLDLAAPENPVILYREATMICAVNSKALKLAGVTNKTAAPAGGAVDRDSQTGELTGIFRDTATSLVWQAVPEPTADELVDAAELGCRKIAEAGITSIHWILISPGELEIVKRLHAEKKLTIRVNVMVPFELLKETEGFESVDTAQLRIGGVFITVDGYLDSKAAALTQPYCDEPGNCGKMLLGKIELTASVQHALNLGFQPVIHAMGDKAVDTALKVIEQTLSDKDVRFRMEQAAVLNHGLIERLKALKIVVSVQPTVISTEFAVWSAITRLGFERAKLLHPLRTLLDAGITVAGGSDCPMEPLDPMLGIHEAVNRASFHEQRLTAEQALRMYTSNAAFCSGEDRFKGSIEVGKLADLTVLSQDPAGVEVTKIRETKVEMTIVNGKIASRSD